MAPKPRPNKDQEQAEIIKRIAQGYQIKPIARELGIPVSTVKRWVREYEASAEEDVDVLDFRNRTSNIITSPLLELAVSAPWSQT